MPVAPRRVCLSPGCGKLVTSGSWCDTHTKSRVESKKQAQKVYDNERGSKHERGYTSKWSRYSVAYRKEHPLCVMCEKQGKLTLAQCVDHIEPVSGPDDPLFWDESNHQGLCLIHHSIKTASEDGGYGNSTIRGL